MISVRTVDFEEQSNSDIISGNTNAHTKPNPHQWDYFHCSEKFREMKLMALVGMAEQQLFSISSLHFTWMRQSYEYRSFDIESSC